MEQKWYSVRQACEVLKIPKSTLYRRIKQGKIQSKKDENNNTLCLIEFPNETDQVPYETTESTQLMRQLREENEFLHQELDARKQEVSAFQKELAESRERSDTIIMQLTRQLGDVQKALEYHKSPWWRRLRLGKGKEENRVG